MSITDHRYKWTRWSTGLTNSQNLKNVYSSSFGYTSTKKKVANGTATAILGSTATALTTQTVTAGITQPDVPRALSLTPGGTTSQLLDSRVVVTGTNVEGKVITDTFQLVPSSSTVINGAKAFKTITSVFIPAQGGTAATITVGTQNKLGVYHRLQVGNTTVKVIQSTAIGATPTIQGVPTVVANPTFLELNLVTPLTAPDGTTFLDICYQYDNWQIGTVYDGAGASYSLYHTSTSTSTSSTSTSTTTTPPTSTSTSSTSTSSTSSSISTSSTSTSSTSTSTTTAP